MNSSILLAGFEPFDGDVVNASIEVARRLDGSIVDGGARVHALELPCVFGRSVELLTQAVDRLAPQLVIVLGQASRRTAVSVERVAINLDDARIPDNAGARPIDRPVVEGGPAAYFATLPIKAIVAEMRDAGIAAELSATAGSFVCNHVFYGLMHHLASSTGDLRAGFIHLPLLPGQRRAHGSGEAGMALDTMVQAVRIALLTSLRERVDRRIAWGAPD